MAKVWQTRLLALGLVVGGAAAVWFATWDIIRLLHALRAGAPLISWDASMVRMLPIGLALFFTGPLAFLPAPAPASRRHRKAKPRRVDIGEVWMLFMVGSLAVSVVAPLVAGLWVRAAAARRGYVLCPMVTVRHDATRWALAPSPGARPHCPRDWEEAAQMEEAMER